MKVVEPLQLAKIDIQNHIYIRHIMLYNLEEVWNAIFISDLNELFLARNCQQQPR